MSEIFEQWRTVSGFPEYMVSSFGRVMTIRNGYIKKPSIGPKGHLYLNLRTKDRFLVHRLVADAFLDAPESEEKLMIDHIDRNPQNNCVSNLRWVTQSQNNMNAGKVHKPTTSKYKGVSFKQDKQKWRAGIKKDGKNIFIGYFDHEEEAAYFYNMKATEIFGEYACLNEVDYNPQIHKTDKKTTSKYRGVSFKKDKNRWSAKIKHNYNDIFIGYFSTETEAAEAYNKKATEILGDKAKLNIFN